MKHKHRYDTCADCGAVKVKRVKLMSHDTLCNCAMAGHHCHDLRYAEARAAEAEMIASGILSPTWQTDKHNMDSAPTVKLESISDIEARLSVCACGHIASTHDVDALGNILSCTVKNCKCDHFRSVPKQEMAA